jgi:aspartokinase-like uncharacterized kinase
MGKPFIREWAIELSFLLLVSSFILFCFSTLSLFFMSNVPEELMDIIKPLHDTHYDMWGFFFGILGIIFGGWIFGDKVLKMREFYNLINTDSRASFIKNLDRIEYLAWKLTSKQEEAYRKKKKELKIKI